jgi:ATP-dependent DNA ligase
MKLYKLYKRAVNGKILEWEIEVENNCFRTISGYTDGIKTTSEWTCCETKNVGKKNATTAEQQALAEATAMHRKRIETGSFGNINYIDTFVYFKPMLAHDYNDYKDKIVWPLFSQPKLDGVRCIVRADGMWSRNGKPIISAPHIFEALKPLFEVNPDLILDGELYANKSVADFNTIISCVRKTKPTVADLETSKKIQYWVYDLPSSDKNFYNRNEELSKMELPECCVKVPTTHVHDEDMINNQHILYVEQGYEGQMLRASGNSLYENKRSKSLLKHKSFVDAEFEILGVEEGKGNLTGKVGRLNFQINGKPFDAAVNGDWEYIERLWKSKDGLIGKTATVKYFELTEDGIPRFPKVIAIRDFE